MDGEHSVVKRRNPFELAATLVSAMGRAGQGVNPVIVIEGPPGVGKTQLLGCIAEIATSKAAPGPDVMVASAHDLTGEMLGGLRVEHATHRAWRRLQGADLLLVDDAHAFSCPDGREALVVRQLLRPLLVDRRRLVLAVTGFLTDLPIIDALLREPTRLPLLVRMTLPEATGRNGQSAGLANEAGSTPPGRGVLTRTVTDTSAVRTVDTPAGEMTTFRWVPAAAGYRGEMTSLSLDGAADRNPPVRDAAHLASGPRVPMSSTSCPETSESARGKPRSDRGTITVLVGRDPSLIRAGIEWFSLDAALRQRRSVVYVDGQGPAATTIASAAVALASNITRPSPLVAWDAFVAALGRIAASPIRRGTIPGSSKTPLRWGPLPPGTALLALPHWDDLPKPLRSTVGIRQLVVASGVDVVVAGDKPGVHSCLVNAADAVVHLEGDEDIARIRTPLVGRDFESKEAPGFSLHQATRGASDALPVIQDEDAAVIGYRTWRLDRTDVCGTLRFRLRSVHQAHHWHRGCTTSFCITCGQAPGKLCKCGLYAHSRLTAVCSDWGVYSNPVIGMVRGWGTVRIGQTGWRSEHAQILGLAVLTDDKSVCADLGMLYDCPAATFPISTTEVTQ